VQLIAYVDAVAGTDLKLIVIKLFNGQGECIAERSRFIHGDEGSFVVGHSSQAACNPLELFQRNSDACLEVLNLEPVDHFVGDIATEEIDFIALEFDLPMIAHFGFVSPNYTFS
jgi:hypothetical protein